MSNSYCTTADLIARPGSHKLASIPFLLDLCELASRNIDTHCGRGFFTKSATLFWGVASPWIVTIPSDVISLTTVTADSNQDDTFTGETWVEETDFRLGPNNAFPKTSFIPLANGRFRLAIDSRYLKAIGVYGYGDGTSDPWKSIATLTATLGDATDTSATISADATGVIEPGHTLRIESEQLFVSALSEDGLTATVERGANGTTGVAHADKTMEIAQYPSNVRQAAIQLAVEGHCASLINRTLQNSRTADTSSQSWTAREQLRRMDQMLGQYIRKAA